MMSSEEWKHRIFRSGGVGSSGSNSATTTMKINRQYRYIETIKSITDSSDPIITECNSDGETTPANNSRQASPELRRNMRSSEKVSELYNRQKSQLKSSGSRKTSLDCDIKPTENSIPLITSPPDSECEDNAPRFDVVPAQTRRSPRTRFISNGKACVPSGEQTTASMSTMFDHHAEKSSISKMASATMESNGFSTSKIMAHKQDSKQIQFGENQHSFVKHQSSSQATSMTMSTDNMIASGKASFEQHQKGMHMGMSPSILQSRQSQSKETKGSHPRLTMFGDLFKNFSPNMLTFSSEVDMEFDELSSIAKTFKNPIISKTESVNMKGSMNKLENKMQNLCQELVNDREKVEVIVVMTDMMHKAWSVPQCGYDLGFNMCKIIRTSRALEALLCNISICEEWKVVFASAQLLEQCLVADNRDYVVDNGLESVIQTARDCVGKKATEEVQVGTGIINHMFKHSENTCKEVVKLNGLETILNECRSSDKTTLRHCASALANLSLYGGSDSQEAMIKLKAPMWLFPLAFHNDDNIKYYACLAITVLVANKELEAEVLKSGTLDLCEPFVSSHNPEDFAKSSTSHIHGQSKNWLERLVPVLMSKREEARTLAAFHFAMEAWIKKTQDQTSVFKEIKAIEPLKKVAGCPNAIASRYAAQALRMIGEEVPHKLSQQVPLWSTLDVMEWIKQIGFTNYCHEFKNSRVDGDILLELDSKMLTDDICIKNGILRKRFMRELSRLKQMTDYSSCDSTNIYGFLATLGHDYTKYTYSLLKCNIDRNTLQSLTDDILLNDCNIENSFHRMKILEHVSNFKNLTPVVENKDNGDSKTLDVFISYRRSNGSQLASLLKVHLQLRGFCVFLDVDRLESGKFDNNLLNSIRQAKNFILVLTPNALNRCFNDDECKDWVHREIVQALQTKCNIIPIMESFEWPKVEMLPEDMKSICYFNGVTWIHDYQDACVDKLERFLRGEMNTNNQPQLGLYRHPVPHGLPPTPGTPQIRSPSQQRRSGSVDTTRIHDF